MQKDFNNSADFVKLFPLQGFGASYVKAIKAPLSGIDLLAVGGVDLTNIGDFLKAGIAGFGIGTSIVDKKLIEREDYEAVTRLAASFVAAVSN